MAEKLRRRLARWLIRILPVDVREAHGAEMQQVLAAAYRDRRHGLRPAVAFWLNAIADIARVAPRQHADALVQDVRYTFRGLRRSPSFAIAALMTIEIGRAHV